MSRAPVLIMMAYFYLPTASFKIFSFLVGEKPHLSWCLCGQHAAPLLACYPQMHVRWVCENATEEDCNPCPESCSCLLELR